MNSKMARLKQVNIVIGRFQPLTLGHLRCVDEAWDLLHIPTVLCMIDTPSSKVDERHPFPSSLTLPIYNNLIQDYDHICDIILVKNADIVVIGETLKRAGYIIRSWSCGTDRYKTYSDMAEKYAEKAGLDPDFQVIEIKRDNKDISATKVRDMIRKNDRNGFYKHTPFQSLRFHLKTGSVFDILRDQLVSVDK